MIPIEHFNIKCCPTSEFRLPALYYDAGSQTDFMILYFMFIYFITFCYKSEVTTQETQVCAHVKFIFNILNILNYYKIYNIIKSFETVVLSVTKCLAIFALWNFFIFPWRFHFYYMIVQIFYIINVFVVCSKSTKNNGSLTIVRSLNLLLGSTFFLI